MDPYYMTVAFHDVDGSSAGERPGIILEPSGEYVFNLEQVRDFAVFRNFCREEEILPDRMTIRVDNRIINN